MVVALLAAVALIALGGCGDDGAEPGASQEATLVLDFTPNAVHAGLYAAEADGYFSDQGIDLKIQQPGATSDAPKLLAAGKADFAVMDINDLAIARNKGADLVAITPLVDVPLASVIAGDRGEIKRPRDLEGKTVGVTGVPSDDAVLDAILRSDGADPDSVKRVTIGFDAVASLAAGKVDAATAFWNAEGVALQEKGIPIREFRLADEAKVRYPELVVVTATETARKNPKLTDDLIRAIRKGSSSAAADPAAAVEAISEAVPGTDTELQQTELKELVAARAFQTSRFNINQIESWAFFAGKHGLAAPRSRRQMGLMFGFVRED
jgi:putative hydroxymethylpyrimidine transport system substrate-binding protein